MTIRTSTRTVTFSRPFTLDGVDGELPAGAYEVKNDEELIQDLSFLAYRRIGTFIHVGPRPGHPELSQTFAINPKDLDDALECDRQP